MQIKPRAHMGIGLIALSMLFFFNAEFAVFDLLPDVFGYILLSLGLSSLSYLNHHFEESAKHFQRMIALSAGRLVFVLVLFGLVNSTDRPTTMLLGNFVFGVLELMTLLPAYKQLFEGLIYAGSRGGVGESVFRPTLAHRLMSRLIRRKSEFDERNTAVTVTESVSLLTSLFVICKVALSVLPEFTVLSDHAEAKVNLYEYVWLFRMGAMLIWSVLGIAWLVLMLRYFIGIYRDGAYVGYLRSRYMQDIYPNKDLFVAKRYKLGSFFLTLGVILSLDLPMEGVNVLPDVLCAVCLLTGVLALRHYLSKSSWKSCTCVICAYAIVSVFETYWQYRYFKVEEYSATAALKGAEATGSYPVLIVISAISAIMFVMVMASVLGCMKDMIRNHAGFVLMHTDMQTYGKLNTLHKQLIRGLSYVMAAVILCAIGGVAYTVLLPYSGMGGDWYTVLASVMWLVNLALGVVLIVLFAEKNSDITEQINNRYLLTTPTTQQQDAE